MISPKLLDELEKSQYRKREYVYLIRCGNSDFYKIGRAVDVNKRRDALQTANPYYLTIVAVLSISLAQPLERKMHKLFAAKRTYGEWFRLSESDVAEFCKSSFRTELKCDSSQPTSKPLESIHSDTES